MAVKRIHQNFIRKQLSVHICQITIKARHRRVCRDRRQILSYQGIVQEMQAHALRYWDNIESRVYGEEVAVHPSNDAGVPLSAHDNARAIYQFFVVPADLPV